MYKLGNKDSAGRVIVEHQKDDGPKDFTKVSYGEMMHVVDWRAFHRPKLWKVYRWQERLIRDGSQMAWVKLAEYEDFNVALDHARKLRKEMTSDAVHH